MSVENQEISPTMRSEMKGHEPILVSDEKSVKNCPVCGEIIDECPQDNGSVNLYCDHCGWICGNNKTVASIGNGQVDSAKSLNIECSNTLNCMHDPEAVLCVSTTIATVRRLTPKECERLMGFPDNWTRIPWRGKSEEECPDGPRYKACGNSMCVNVMRWLGLRIEQVEQITKEVK